MQSLQKQLTCLFIHGFGQSGTIFDGKLKVLQKELRKHFQPCELLFPTALNPLGEDKFGWIYLDESDKNNREAIGNPVAHFFSVEQTLNQFRSISQSNPNINIIMAFSQGAMVMTWILALRQLDETLFPNLKGAILVSGGGTPLPTNPELQFLHKFVQYPEQEPPTLKIQLPILFVVGENDQVIEKRRSDSLVEFFESADCRSHDGSHYVPQKREYLDIFTNYIKKQLND